MKFYLLIMKFRLVNPECKGNFEKKKKEYKINIYKYDLVTGTAFILLFLNDKNKKNVVVFELRTEKTMYNIHVWFKS